MKALFLILALLSPVAARSDVPVWAPQPASGTALESLLWHSHVVVVFGDSPLMPAVTEQLRLLESRWPELAQNHVTVVVDTDPSDNTEIRRRFRPTGFDLVVIGADGQIALRRPTPRDVREILRTIDRLPMVRDQRRMNLNGR